MTATTATTQSIFTILDSLATTTSVPSQIPKMQPMTLPRTSFPTSKQFENKKELVKWACLTGNIHAVLQKGIQKHLIDVRAKFKGCKKGETWTNDYGQSNVDAYTWEVQTRPNSKPDIASAKQTARFEAGVEMATAMKVVNVDDAIILASLTPVYGADLAQEIISSLN